MKILLTAEEDDGQIGGACEEEHATDNTDAPPGEQDRDRKRTGHEQ